MSEKINIVTRIAIWNAINKELKDVNKIMNATYDATDNATDITTKHATWDATGAATYIAIGAVTYIAINKELEDED